MLLISQWTHFFSCPFSIYGSTNPRNSQTPVPFHLAPYPLTSLTSSIIYEFLVLRVCMFIHMHSSSILLIILREFSFRYFSFNPLYYPQNPSEARGACFYIARAPAVKIDGLLGFRNRSSSVITVWSLIKEAIRLFLSGGTVRSWLPTVRLIPRQTRNPQGSSAIKNSRSSFYRILGDLPV